jgi:small subunit ribosomal protein S17
MPKRVLTGKVVSNKMEKTGVCAVEGTRPHPKYGKAQKITKKYKFHDEGNTAQPGDVVRIIESRPLSREKSWDLLEVVTKTEQI